LRSTVTYDSSCRATRGQLPRAAVAGVSFRCRYPLFQHLLEHLDLGALLLERAALGSQLRLEHPHPLDELVALELGALVLDRELHLLRDELDVLEGLGER